MRKTTLIKALALLLSFAMLMTGLPAPSIAESVATATDTVVEQNEDIVIEDDPVLTEDEEVPEEPELPVEEPEEPPVEDDPVTEPEVPTEDDEDAVFPEDDTESADTAGDDADVDADPSEEIEEPADDELVIEDETDTEQPIESLPEEDPDTPDEPVVEDDPIISDETIEDEPITEDETEDAPIVVEHPVQAAVAANGYTYLMAEQSIAVYNTPELYEQTYTVHSGVLLVTDFLELDGWHIVEVQFMTATGEAVLAYAYADELPEQPLTNGEVSAVAQMTSYALVMLDYGEAFMFMVEAEPVGAAVDEVPPVEEQPSEIPEEPEISDIPVVDDESENEVLPVELPIEEVLLAAEGDFVLVTTDTRAFLAVDDSAADDYEGDLTLGYFVNEAAVQVDAIEQDSLGRSWYLVRYMYGDTYADGTLKWTETDTIYVLAGETIGTDTSDFNVTDYAFDYAPMTFALRSTTAMNGFSLRDISADLGNFFAGQTGLHGSSGRDSEYKQIATMAGHGKIYATPHYLEGYVVYCLEHPLPGPGERISGGGYQPTGPYTVVDLTSYMNTPGYSGVMYKDSTMHAIGWVLRHTVPFMELDRSDSDNRTWSRVAGQFAIREVIKQLEGAQYVRDYWQMEDFYAASDNAPAVYLEYARWLAVNGIARASMTGKITASNKSVTTSGGMTIGTVTLTTDADLIRIRKSYGTVTGHTYGEDNSYYYLNSGDTITIASNATAFSFKAESMSSGDEEANFLVGVSEEAIQKVLIPQIGLPYPLESISLSFEVSYGSVSVKKTDASTGKVLAGATFELISGSTVIATATTGADGVVTFTNVPPGTYTIRETKAPEGYTLGEVTVQTVTVSNGKTSSATFANDKITSRLKIIKTDEQTGERLAGASFTITRLSGLAVVSGMQIGESITIVTDVNGEITTGWLEWGRYRIEETAAPAGFINSGFSKEINAYEDGKTYSFTVENTPMSGGLRLIKTDGLTDSPIAGVQFDIYDANGTLVASMTTDANGVATAPSLTKGSYTVREHDNPNGYVADLVELKVEVHSDATTELTATNTPIQGKIRIVKKDALTGELLSGAEFTITRISGIPAHNGAGDGEVVATITTDNNGVAESPLLTYGKYRIKETVAPSGFVNSDFSTDVTISEDNLQTIEVMVENEPMTGGLRLTKTDSMTGFPIAGVQFDIYDANGMLVASMTTDTNGVATAPSLTKGSYTVREHNNPEGYVADLVELQAVVHSNATTELTATNTPIQGSIRIVKKDALTGDLLSGAEFTITRVSGIPAHNGVGNGEVVATITTDANGVAESPLLTYGIYRIAETKAPDHFVLSDFSTDVTICEDNLKTIEIVVENEPTKGYLRLNKTDSLNGMPIDGVQFDIYTSPTIIRAIYDAVERMGFTSGNVLEPAMGVGNFFGMMPESMSDSRLYGVELDSISGRIAKQLYPKADITVAGFETTDRRDFFDLAVGNVPFGNYKVDDKAYNRLGFSIHNYFIAKMIDQVRPGGVVAVVTSRYTMDQQSPEVRKYLAERAELLGAIRLPNDAFRANAGTDVVADILFFQKRERAMSIEPDWVHLGVNADGFAINQYFIDHPEMVLGEQTSESTQYGQPGYTVSPTAGVTLADELRDAVQRIHGTYVAAALPELAEGEEIRESIPADPNVKNYSYTIVDGQVYYRENSIMVRPDLNQTAQERVKGLVGLRDCVHALIDAQMDEAGDSAIQGLQEELNQRYDAFTAQYGLINSRGNALAFSDDSSYYFLCSLEVLDDQQQLKRKADMFAKRTIKQQKVIEHVDTAVEALTVSIAERVGVDLPFMAQLTGKPEDELAEELTGVIFPLPESVGAGQPLQYVTANEYLSGNVRQKLRDAQRLAEHDALFIPNVEALAAAQPKDLDASEIDIRLGATWVHKDYIQQFMYETFNTPYHLKRQIQVHFSPYTAEWSITGKTAISSTNVAAYTTFGTDRANAYRILEDTLNLRDTRIYDIVLDEEGREKRVLNQQQTTLAQQKQQAIKDAFRDWVWRDPDRRHALVQEYNERFNSTRPREFDGSHISFVGINPEITLREHQRNAVAHVLYGGNTLLAHEVGAGKTFEMIAACMESKRLGLCQKAMFVVPNHLTEQWASEFLRLYPSARILVTTKKDFERHNRQKFCSRIATGDYDAVIIGHSQFERIPVSQARQERFIQEQIDEVVAGIDELKRSHGEQFTIKQLVRTQKQLELRLKKLQAEGKKDDVVTFEQLGVDRLYVDEAHGFKNLFLYTKMRNVAGLSTSEAQKSSDMFMKCRYMDELTGGRGIVFATGTPVSNSMTELYTMQRYLQYSTLKRSNLTHFDAWASTFGETTTAIELAPEGTGYRARTRFARFFNLPELMTIFKEVADIKTADQLHLPTPKANFETVVVQPTEQQAELVQALSERAAEVHSGNVDPSIDNMLKITSDGRKLGLDQRLINPMLPDDPGSKVNACVRNIHRIWQEGMDQRLTQLVFCDISTPKGTAGAENQEFSVYDDIRAKLISMGIPAEEIAFIHDANTEARKKDLFGKVRSGQVRVLMGSTAKMGAGTNVQDRLVALHDLDCPWRPGDLEQRAGRIVRQGNQNEEVFIYRYVTEKTFDAYLWQTVENKQKFISQIMTSKSPVRSCEDVDETALSYAEIKALCAGDPTIKEKMDLDIDVVRLRLMKADHQSKQYRLEDQLLRYFPQVMEQQRGFITGFQADLERLAAHPLPEKDFIGMEVMGKRIMDKEKAGEALLDACKAAAKSNQDVAVGHYRGLDMSIAFEPFSQLFYLTLRGQMSHKVELGSDARGNLVRIENVLANIPNRLATAQAELENQRQQMEAARAEVGKPFPQEAELQTKSARLAELDAKLNMDRKPSKAADLDEKQSIQDALRQPGRPGNPTRPNHREEAR